jgi:hypothetical protein
MFMLQVLRLSGEVLLDPMEADADVALGEASDVRDFSVAESV